MPTALTLEPSFVEAPRKRWTRKEFEELANGPFGDEKFELVDGDVISTMGKNRPHVIALVLLQRWLVQTFGFDFVNPESPVDVGARDNRLNRPEADLIVLKRPSHEILHENPQPNELHLVVEIANTTLNFDLSTKARLYARAGIVEYWILDVPGRRMIVHREPQHGRYRSVIAYGETERIATLAASAAELRIGDVLPPWE